MLKLIEYRFLILEHSFEIYGGLIALTFAGLGIWLGVRVTARRREVIVKEVAVPAPAGDPFVVNERKREELGIAMTRAALEWGESALASLTTAGPESSIPASELTKP